MFKVTIKQYVKPFCALILIAAVLNSGCISTSSSNTAEDVPVVKAEPETPKILGTTVDGIPHYKFDSGLGAFDIDGDGIYDFRDSAVGPSDASRHNNNIAIAIRANFGIPTTSKLHQDYPNIEEFRVRQWDLDNDGNHDKIEILINYEVVHSTTTDVNGKNGVDFGDALTELGCW